MNHVPEGNPSRSTIVVASDPSILMDGFFFICCQHFQ